MLAYRIVCALAALACASAAVVLIAPDGPLDARAQWSTMLFMLIASALSLNSILQMRRQLQKLREAEHRALARYRFIDADDSGPPMLPPVCTSCGAPVTGYCGTYTIAGNGIRLIEENTPCGCVLNHARFPGAVPPVGTWEQLMPTRQYEPPGRAIGIARSVGRLIAAARKRKNWTQSDLGEALGCHQVTIARWESGAVPINVVDLVLAANLLDCTPSSFLPGVDPASADALLAAAADIEATAAALRAKAEAYDGSEADSGS